MKNPILDTYTLLAEALHADPLLVLANSVVWLDPMWQCNGEEMDDESDELSIALAVTRTAFPDIYAGIIERIRSGDSYPHLDRYLCSEITRRGIPLDSLDTIGFGIPFNAAGIALDDPDLYGYRPDLLPIVACFGIEADAGHYSIDIPEAAYTAGQIAADRLLKQPDPHWQQVGWALAWVFSCSGNSLIDLNDESLAEIPPLTWQPEDVAFAIELIEEADGILSDVNAGLALLADDPTVLAALAANVKHIYRAIAKGKKHVTHLRLEWPVVSDRAGGTTVADSEFLQLRDHAA